MKSSMRIFQLHENADYQEIQFLRKTVSCLLIDFRKLETNDEFLVDDDNFKASLQPLRIIPLRLNELKKDWKIFYGPFRRNTMIVASDQEVREKKEITAFLEAQGVALLMVQKNADGKLSREGFIRSLTSLRFESLLIESQTVMNEFFS